MHLPMICTCISSVDSWRGYINMIVKGLDTVPARIVEGTTAQKYRYRRPGAGVSFRIHAPIHNCASSLALAYWIVDWNRFVYLYNRWLCGHRQFCGRNSLNKIQRPVLRRELSPRTTKNHRRCDYSSRWHEYLTKQLTNVKLLIPPRCFEKKK